MRIQEVRVHRYGPLADLDLTNLNGFTLIFGENETGKTLLIDAILRLLLTKKRERDLFARLDRVELEPDGYIEIQHNDGVFRLPEQGSLPELMGINADDLRNVLVVRSSDLQIAEGEPKEYYAKITDQLMGIHREPIRKTIVQLRKNGRLTNTGKVSNSQEHEKLGSRVIDAVSLLERIDDISDRLNEMDAVKLEGNLLTAKEGRDRAADELEILAKAQKRVKFDTGNDLLSAIEEITARIAAIPKIQQVHYDDWRDAQRDIDVSNELLDELGSALEKNKTNMEEAHNEVAKRAEELNTLTRKESAIVHLERAAYRYREDLENSVGRQGLKILLPKAVVGIGLLLGLSIIGLILGQAPSVLEPISIMLSVILAFGIVGLVITRVQAGKQASAWEELRLLAAELSLQADGIEVLLAALQQFDDSLEQAREKESSARGAFGIAEEQLENKKKGAIETEEKIARAKNVLAKLRDTTGVSSFEDLQKTMNERAELESRRQDLIVKLEERFDPVQGTLDVKIQTWRSRIDELASFADAAEGIDYEEHREDELERQVATLEGEIFALDQALEAIRGELAEVAAEADRILLQEVSFLGDTLEDLAFIEKKLRAFTEEAETNAHLAWSAIAIFKDIQAEEEEKVKGLFGEDDLASQYFRSITGGAYEGVSYDPKNGELNVVRGNGEYLRGYALSSGAYDQLYMATRLSLADRLLEGQPGFLILDDPFLTSDTNRLSREMDILLNLARSGWQILYFSVKDEIRTLLRDPIENEEVDEIVMDTLAD